MSPVRKESNERKKAGKIFSLLDSTYPGARSALNFADPFQLLIATILSAQCTDERVNKVTPELFRKYKIPSDFLQLPDAVLQEEIYSTGFYRQKTKSIKSCCKELVEKYNSEVPEDFGQLSSLPGVGRKTASVVAGNAFGIPSIAVDTHVLRLTNLIGFIESRDPKKIEYRWKELLPENKWVKISNLLILHGRKTCIARRPKCDSCVIRNLCEYGLLVKQERLK